MSDPFESTSPSSHLHLHSPTDHDHNAASPSSIIPPPLDSHPSHPRTCNSPPNLPTPLNGHSTVTTLSALQPQLTPDLHLSSQQQYTRNLASFLATPAVAGTVVAAAASSSSSVPSHATICSYLAHSHTRWLKAQELSDIFIHMKHFMYRWNLPQMQVHPHPHPHAAAAAASSTFSLLSSSSPYRPLPGSIYLYNKTHVRWRKDEYTWQSDRHMNLKLGGKEEIICYYGKCSEKFNEAKATSEKHLGCALSFQRRGYCLIDDPDIVLVHYLDGRNVKEKTAASVKEEKLSETDAKSARREENHIGSIRHAGTTQGGAIDITKYVHHFCDQSLIVSLKPSSSAASSKNLSAANTPPTSAAKSKRSKKDNLQVPNSAPAAAIKHHSNQHHNDSSNSSSTAVAASSMSQGMRGQQYQSDECQHHPPVKQEFENGDKYEGNPHLPLNIPSTSLQPLQLNLAIPSSSSLSLSLISPASSLPPSFSDASMLNLLDFSPSSAPLGNSTKLLVILASSISHHCDLSIHFFSPPPSSHPVTVLRMDRLNDTCFRTHLPQFSKEGQYSWYCKETTVQVQNSTSPMNGDATMTPTSGGGERTTQMYSISITQALMDASALSDADRAFSSLTLSEMGINANDFMMPSSDGSSVPMSQVSDLSASALFASPTPHFTRIVSSIQRQIRWWLFRRHDAAQKLQSVARGMLARRSMKRMREASVTIQSVFRQRKVRRDFVKLQRATRLIQERFREGRVVVGVGGGSNGNSTNAIHAHDEHHENGVHDALPSSSPDEGEESELDSMSVRRRLNRENQNATLSMNAADAAAAASSSGIMTTSSASSLETPRLHAHSSSFPFAHDTFDSSSSHSHSFQLQDTNSNAHTHTHLLSSPPRHSDQQHLSHQHPHQHHALLSPHRAHSGIFIDSPRSDVGSHADSTSMSHHDLIHHHDDSAEPISLDHEYVNTLTSSHDLNGLLLPTADSIGTMTSLSPTAQLQADAMMMQ